MTSSNYFINVPPTTPQIDHYRLVVAWKVITTRQSLNKPLTTAALSKKYRFSFNRQNEDALGASSIYTRQIKVKNLIT